MVNFLKRFWDEHPLLSVLIIALIPRLIAAFLSKGYGMHDDHFGPIEQPFIIMHDITYWTLRVNNDPHGHSIVYPLLHYGLFNALQSMGMRDPQDKMLVVRLLHALYSLLVVSFGYKIAEHFSSKDIAKKTGIVLALFWAFPYLSVRNLIEMVCIPPLMAGVYYILKSPERRSYVWYSGICFGMAFVFRYQTLFVTATVAMLLLYQKQWKSFLYFSLACFFTMLLVQGSADIFAWGYPFAAFLAYVGYNSTHSLDYTTGPWYNYLLLVAGAMVPPTSFVLLYGFLKNWKKTLMVFLPVVIFFVFHSYFPNKQERFIFSVIPLILTLSVAGWLEITQTSPFWLKHRKLVRGLWIWFWIINFVLLVPFTTYYAKKSRVESLYYLYGKPVTGLLLIGGKLGVIQPPMFYADQYPVAQYQINNNGDLQQVQSQLKQTHVQPNYALMFGTEDFEQRKFKVETALQKKLILEKTVEPSFLDYVLFRLNPRGNKNQTSYVLRVQ
jgi:Alg9-like mannosyltransferase family